MARTAKDRGAEIDAQYNLLLAKQELTRSRATFPNWHTPNSFRAVSGEIIVILQPTEDARLWSLSF
jgi:hypothetical protein